MIFDKYLKNYIIENNPVNILHLNIFKGKNVEWFLDNLLNNSNSKYIIVDDFKGPDIFIYIDKTFNFDSLNTNIISQINSSSKENQTEILKLNINDGLKTLYNKYQKKYFDIIFFEGIPDPDIGFNDNLVYIILFWNLLKIGGVLIFDEYYFNENNKFYYHVIDINNFFVIYKNQIDILYKKDKLIIKKIEYSNKLLNKSFIDLTNRITNYEQNGYNLIFSQKKKEILKYDIKFSKNPDYSFLTNSHSNILINKINKFREKKYKNDLRMLDNLTLMGFFYKEYLYKVNDFYKDIDKSNKIILSYIDLLYNTNNYCLIGRAGLLEAYNLIKLPNKKKINFLEMVHNFWNTKKKKDQYSIIDKNLHSYLLNLKNIDKLEYYVLYFSYEYKNNNNSVFDKKNGIHRIFSNASNSSDIKKMSKNIKNKIDYLYLGFAYKKIHTLKYPTDYYYIQSLLNSIVFGLSVQSKNGSAYYYISDFFTSISIEILNIVRNFYDNVSIVKLQIINNRSLSSFIKAEKFRGITKKELDDLYDVIDKIYIMNPSAGRDNTDYNFITRLLDIKHVESDKNIISNIMNYNNIKLNNSYEKFKLVDDIYKIIYGKDKNKIKIIKETLLTRQLEEYMFFINKHGLIDYYINSQNTGEGCIT